jgi:acyl dehydratase
LYLRERLKTCALAKSSAHQAAQTLFPQYIGDVFIAFTEASCKFLKEVHAGDTLYSALEIVALTPQGDSGQVTTRATVHNQRGELDHGFALYCVRTVSKPLSPKPR